MARNDFESNYLMHHGILGQKWGKRNGPPYPLGASDHSASEKKAGWRKSLENKREMKKAKKAAQKEQKQFVEQMKKTYRKDTPSWSNDEKRELVGKAVTPKQKKELEDAYKAWSKAYEKEEAFWESKECTNAHNDAYDATYKWFEKNEPEQLKSMIDDNNGDKYTLARYHDFRKTYEGYDDEYTSKAQSKYYKEHNIDPEAERGAFTTWQSKVDDVTDSLVGKYGNKPIGTKNVQLGYDTIRKYTRSGVVSLSRKYQ